MQKAQDIDKIMTLINDLPSVNLLATRNRSFILSFLIQTFKQVSQVAVVEEKLLIQLSDYLEAEKLEEDEEHEVSLADTYEIKAKKYIRQWTNKGFLTNYEGENGEIFYELSSHAHKTIDWVFSLEKKEFVGTESKFKTIFNQLKELVEFTNEDKEKRIAILEARKAAIEQEIEDLKTGEALTVYENYEIIPRFQQLNQSAKELLSDFKEVEDNFKDITKEIYQKHADASLSKTNVLDFTFDALDELQESEQGKSFYAFWEFLLIQSSQEEWNVLVESLYETLTEKGIEVKDTFLKKMKQHLHLAGKKVYVANDKMATKLSRIIGEKGDVEKEQTKRVIEAIKIALTKIAKAGHQPKIELELDTKAAIKLILEKKLTFSPTEKIEYNEMPQLASDDLQTATQMEKLFNQVIIDRKILRSNIKKQLAQQKQMTLLEIINACGGITKGLAEVFGYFSILKEYKTVFNEDSKELIIFDHANQKGIKVPQIIVTI